MTKYYVSNAGLDANSGTAPSAPWQTITKVNATTFQPGDVIVFRRGDTFYGSLLIKGVRSQDQRKVTVGAYGTGPMPKLSRYKIAKSTSWVNHSGNIWKIDLTDLTKFTGDEDVTLQGVNVGFLRVDGVIKGVKRWAIGELVADWEFYSDEAQWLYVYSATNPGPRAAEICAAVGQRILNYAVNNDGYGVRYTNLDLVGCAGHGINGILKDVDLRGCWLHELGGGHLVSFATPNTRYGNGVETWAGSSRIEAMGNVMWDIYDVACTMQGDAVSLTQSWTDIWFKKNVIFRCNQTFEVWSTLNGNPATPGAGFVRTGFVDNICLDAGYAWSSDVRPDQTTKCHLLIYAMEAPSCDIRVKNNKFYAAKGSLIARPTGVTTLPTGYNLDDNHVFLRSGQLIHNQASYTAEQFTQFATAYGTGRNCKVELLLDDAPSNLEQVLRKLTNLNTGIASAGTISENNISELFGLSASLSGEIDNLQSQIVTTQSDLAASISAAIKVPIETTSGSVAGADGFAKIATITITDALQRWNGALFYMHGGDSGQSRHGMGVVSMQVVPGAGMTAGTTYVDLDVVELLPWRNSGGVEQLAASDFKAVVTAETGTQVVVLLYFNIGKDNFAKLRLQPLTVMGSSTFTQTVFHNLDPLAAVLPAGTVVSGVNTDAGFQLKPSRGNGAPATTPSYVGQTYLDLVNKKEYTAFGIASSADWVIIN